MAVKTVNESTLTSIADAIRSYAGTSSSIAFPQEFISKISDINTQWYGSIDSSPHMVRGGQVTNSSIKYLYPYAFAGFCKNISGNGATIYSISFDFPELTAIGTCAFMDTGFKFIADFPKVSVIYSSAFYSNMYLQGARFNSCYSILGYAFTNCRGLSSISFPVCNYIGEYAFQACSSLTAASFPTCSYIGTSAF